MKVAEKCAARMEVMVQKKDGLWPIGARMGSFGSKLNGRAHTEIIGTNCAMVRDVLVCPNKNSSNHEHFKRTHSLFQPAMVGRNGAQMEDFARSPCRRSSRLALAVHLPDTLSTGLACAV